MDEPHSIQHERRALAPTNDPAAWDEPLLADDLEAAYQRALAATDAIEREIHDEPLSASDIPESTPVAVIANEFGADSSSAAHPAPASQATTASREDSAPRVTEKQVIEAALFVGGMPLTAKKLSSLFHTDHGFGFVECLLDELTQQYAAEGRPYTITLGEGGYRLTLLPEFEPVRNKVFGYGPKDVKLSQESLEVLALVAYKQPITKSQIEAFGKTNAGSILRQLLQRELIRIDREHVPPNSKGKHDPAYLTTPRFLSLFGLSSVNDLPVADDFAFK